MAPQAKLIPYKVFGCAGPTNLVGKAIDWATDPNRDGNPADHVDVINMSLGADYASPQDGDGVEANAASRLGVTVVAAAGNAGDEYDATGTPADASRVIAVANTVDAYSQIDRLEVSFNGTPQEAMGAERSVLYKRWATADLSGHVVRVTQAGNANGCKRVTQNLTGKVALVTWHDGNPACGSIDVAGNLQAAGARGFILGSDSEQFAGGINGNAAIPGVLATASAARAIRNALSGDQIVTVTGTTANAFRQLLPRFNDTVDASSSRGSTAAGAVKPDVGAVGNSVFSVDMGSGHGGTSMSGTSMASPMVAGLAALVRAGHPNWTPEQVKADVMNTAGQNLYTRANHQGHVYAPNRVGAGRIRADVALDNEVLAYVRDDVGSVSVSFGPIEAAGALTRSKTVKVVNKSATTAHFALSYHAVTSVPGVTYKLSRTSLTLASGATGTFAVRLVINRFGAMTKTHDAALPLTVSGVKREFLADASGRVVLSPAGSYTGPALRVPVYSAPRPVSRMTHAGTATLRGGKVEKGGLRLSGSGLDRGRGSTRIRAAVSGFELAARSGRAPTCRTASANRCVHTADERSADLKYIGVTSDAPVVRRPTRNATAYFSISTQRAWDTPVGRQEFDIVIDTNGDNVADAIAYNTRLNGSDVFLSELVDVTRPAHPFVRDDELINDRLGDVDTALFNSDTMVMPVWVHALGRLGGSRALPGFSARHSRMRYGVVSFGEQGVVDDIGVNLHTRRPKLNSNYRTTDVLHPGLAIYNRSMKTFHTLGYLLIADRPGSTMTVRRDVAAYRRDHGRGALLVHYQNALGKKEQLVTLRSG
jgi:subtilisin family serine protease